MKERNPKPPTSSAASAEAAAAANAVNESLNDSVKNVGAEHNAVDCKPDEGGINVVREKVDHPDYINEGDKHNGEDCKPDDTR
ncbi:hypothetical protein OAK15_05195 [Verrucomicrobia bacterium]|nr:hypothetical protein [Verrucomicrobiota bacterium]